MFVKGVTWPEGLGVGPDDVPAEGRRPPPLADVVVPPFWNLFLSLLNWDIIDVGRSPFAESSGTVSSIRVPVGVLAGSRGLGGGGSCGAGLLATGIGGGCFSNPPGILAMDAVSDTKAVL
jgi:hypothetical protein